MGKCSYVSIEQIFWKGMVGVISSLPFNTWRQTPREVLCVCCIAGLHSKHLRCIHYSATIRSALVVPVNPLYLFAIRGNEHILIGSDGTGALMQARASRP